MRSLHSLHKNKLPQVGFGIILGLVLTVIKVVGENDDR